MARLKKAEVHRRGVTARNFEFETGHVDLAYGRGVIFEFEIASKGGGHTRVQVKLSSDDFTVLASAMVSENRQIALQVMADTLAKEISRQPVLDRTVRTKGQESVVESAREAYMEAPQDRDHAEKLTYDLIQKLVKDLIAREEPSKSHAVKN